ncbi:hypothetical protein LTR22_026000 [Elasticomyces elasticus]|nr:hypothetical protein LTR22_026000 [Elasticomyces elasticus]
MGHRVMPSHQSYSIAPRTNHTSVLSQLPPDVPTLLTLPPEIRNLIYGYIFQGTHSLAHPRGAMPPIIHICRKLRAEASGIFYFTSIFDVCDFHSGVAWLVRLEPRIRDLVAELQYDCGDETREQPMWWAQMGGEGCVGVKEEARLEAWRETLVRKGVVVETGVLKVGVRVRGVLLWTDDPVRQ